MKLLFVTTIYPTNKEPFRGIYIQNRAKALLDEGVNVKVAFFTENINECTTDSFSNVFKYTFSKIKFNKKIRNIDEKFKELLKKFNPDLVIFFIASIALENKIMALNKSLRYSKFYEGRNIFFEHQSNLPKIVQFLSFLKRKKFIKRMSYIFFCSKLLEKDFNEKRIRKPKFKTVVLTNGFDQNIFCPLSTPKIFDKSICKIIAVGNLIETKGFVHLVESINDVFKHSNKMVQLTIVGSGSNERAIKMCEIPANVSLKMIDQLSQRELLKELQKNDFFILPSIYESFGCVYLEAMSQGLITVGCQNQGPSVFIKDGINGFLVSDTNKESLKDFLYKVQNNKIDLDQISKNAVNDSKQYSWKSFAKKFINEVK